MSWGELAFIYGIFVCFLTVTAGGRGLYRCWKKHKAARQQAAWEEGA
jgi:hypothetical protein